MQLNGESWQKLSLNTTRSLYKKHFLAFSAGKCETDDGPISNSSRSKKLLKWKFLDNFQAMVTAKSEKIKTITISRFGTYLVFLEFRDSGGIQNVKNNR